MDFLDSSWSPTVSAPRQVEQKLEEEEPMVGRHGLALARAQTMMDLGELEEELVVVLVVVASKRSEVIAVTFQETNHLMTMTVEPAALP